MDWVKVSEETNDTAIEGVLITADETKEYNRLNTLIKEQVNRNMDSLMYNMIMAGYPDSNNNE